jgi:hypothetical protein
MGYSRVLVAFVVVLLAGSVWVATAAAGPPDKEPAPGQDMHGVTGVCSFPTSQTFPGANNGFSIFHVQKDGTSWLWGGGNSVARVTNDLTGAYVDLNTTGPGKITFNDDGSASIDGTGHWLVGYGPHDSPSSDLVYYSGHIRLDVSPIGQLTLVSYVGAPPEDVCAMIS